MPDDTALDASYFTDGNDLSAYLDDQRIADTQMRSSFENAQGLIADFAAREGAGAWPSLDRREVAGRLQTLIAPASGGSAGTGYRSMDQSGLNMCGPASLLVMAAGRDPVAVATYAIDLFETGTGALRSFSVTASADLLNADFAEMSTRGRIASQAEWMMLSAIRNATEAFWQPEWTGNPDQELAGMTRPEELADWMRQTGIWSNVTDAGRWATNPGIPDATAIELFEGTDVAMLIHANLLDESTIVGGDEGPKAHVGSLNQYFPNHWVILLSQVTPQISDNSLNFSVWTWTGRLRLNAPQQVFIDNYFGTVTASL